MAELRIINLLPPERRTNLRRGMVLHSVTLFLHTLMAGVILLTVVGLISLGGIWGIIFTSSGGADFELDKEILSYNERRSEIASRNTVLSALNELGSSRAPWSYIIEELLSASPPGLTITDLYTDTADSMMVFSGKALTRNTLILLEDRLLLIPWVVTLEAPSANLIDRTNAEYEFRLEVDLVRALDELNRDNSLVE